MNSNKRIDYESPAIEELEIETEQFFAGSGDGNGSADDWPYFDEN